MNWRIPLFQVSVDAFDKEAVMAVLSSEWLTMGEATLRFEEAFAAHIGVKHAIAVCNGTAALHLALVSMGVGAGDEVICPSLTFVAGANSVLAAGAKPVFADISGLDDLNISPASVESRVTNRTKAIQVMHYGGHPADMDAIMSLARKRGLKVLEDCAHSPGAGKNGWKCGAVADMACFSFFSNKNMTTGEGGMVTTNEEALASAARALRSHGMSTLTWDRHRGHAYSYDVTAAGYNYRIDEVRSALGLSQLAKLEKWNLRRKELSRIYREEIRRIPGLSVPFGDDEDSACHLMVVVLPKGTDREALMSFMKEKGIQTSIHYPPIHSFSFYRGLYGNLDKELPLTTGAGARLLTLPLYPGLPPDDIRTVTGALKAFFAAKGGQT